MPPKHADPAAQQELTDKDKSTYKLLVRIYDNREYARGVRTADQLLAHYPDHADTKGIKALCLHAILSGKSEPTDEAYTLVKEGIKNQFKSCVCWHALGTMSRADKKDEEAMKAFKTALACDPQIKNERTGNVLRDMSSLSVHLRDWETFTEARKKLLSHNSAVRANWVCYAMGHHQLGNFQMAGGILDVMGTVMEIGDKGYERNEVVLYRASLHLQAREPQKALDLLKRETVTDKIEVLHIESEAYLALNKAKLAEEACFKLLEANDRERDVLFRLAQVRKISNVTPFKFNKKDNGPFVIAPNEAFCAMLDEVAQRFPKMDAAKRLALDYCPVSQFEARLKKYCAPYVAKMIPSIVSVLKSLYNHPEKAAIIEKVFTEWEKTYIDTGKSSPEIVPSATAPKNPLQFLCLLEFLASHFMRMGSFDLAHAYIDRAIKHTPTIEMLYLMKAKIYSRQQGKQNEAAEMAEKARVLDLQDKYVNGKAAKYYLRAGKIEEAENRLAQFHRVSTVPGDTYLTMFDSQCRWYERELGDCYLAKGDVIGALHCYLLNERHAKEDFDEVDTLQFHALKRGSIRPWTQTMKCYSHFDSSAFSQDVAPRIVRALLRLDEIGIEKAKEETTPRPEMPEKIDEPEDAARIAKAKQLLFEPSLENPLDQCGPYVKAMNQHRPDSVETHALSFEVGFRTQRFLQCVVALQNIKRLQGAFAGSKQAVPKAADGYAEMKERLTAKVQGLAAGAVKDLALKNMAAL